MVYICLDVIMIEKLLLLKGVVEVDCYVFVFCLLDVVNFGGFLLVGLLLFMFVCLFKMGVFVCLFICLVIIIIWLGVIMVVVLVCFFVMFIMMVFYINGDVYFGEILQWFMFIFIFMSGGYVYGIFLMVNVDLKFMNIIFVIGIGFNLVFNLLFIFWQGVVGVVIVIFVIQSFIFLV